MKRVTKPCRIQRCQDVYMQDYSFELRILFLPFYNRWCSFSHFVLSAPIGLEAAGNSAILVKPALKEGQKGYTCPKENLDIPLSSII